MNCKKCKKPVDVSETIEGFCGQCILVMGSGMRTLSKDDLKRLKSAVNEETAGLMSMEVMKQVLEEMYDRLSAGKEEVDDIITHTAIQIQRLAGLGMCREMLKFSQALGKLALDQEEEVRIKMKKLSELGER